MYYLCIVLSLFIKNKNMKTMKKVTPDQLAIVLSQVETAKPVTLVAQTVVTMNKTTNGRGSEPNPFYNRVYKTQESNVFVSIDYEKAVNKRLVKEGKDADFEAQARKWGDRIGTSPLLKKTGTDGNMNYYIQVYFVTNNTPVVTYDVMNDEGELVPTDKSVFESYIPQRTSSGNQGLDEEVVVRTMKLENIKEIRIDGNVYMVEL